jgi:hypothetical protein
MKDTSRNMIMLFTCLVFVTGVLAQNQDVRLHKIIPFKDTVPCFVKIHIKANRIRISRASDSISFVNDSIGYIKEQRRKSDISNNLTYVYIKNLDLLHIIIYFQNISKDKGARISEPTGKKGALKFELFKKSNSKLTKIKFNNTDAVNDFADPEVSPGEIDSSFRSLIYTDYTKLDTGEYLIRGAYKQKCGNSIRKKYTNDVHFYLID